jgi:hypothetical protein
MGGLYLGSQWLSGCVPGSPQDLSSPEVAALLDEFGETILPATPGSPGAKAARIGEFMQAMVTDCYDEPRRNAFVAGVSELMDQGFLSMNQADRIDFLGQREKEALVFNEQRKAGSPKHYFSLMKELVMQGYFSSEAGATTALRHVPIPGRYDGCIDYVAGTPAWAHQG